MSFVDENWLKRMGPIEPPPDGDTKAEMFFRQDSRDLYVVLKADVSELHEALNSLSDSVIR